MIHILDKQTDQIVAFLKDEVIAASHDERIDYYETLDFTIRNSEKSQYAIGRNRAVIQADDGSFHEFIIDEPKVLSDQKEVSCTASFLDLDKQRIISPITLNGQTLESAADNVLSGTEWQVGTVEFSGSQTITFDSYQGAFQAIKQIASNFESEMRFRVEISGNKIIGRYVDFFKHRGQFRGKEVEFGKDLLDIQRTENTDDVVTALFCVGPEREDGTRLTTTVVDNEALQRWGRNGRHLFGIYEPESTDQNMTLEQLTQYGETELAKRINSVVQYKTTQAALDSVEGLEHEKVFLADTIRIKDLHFTPPLYVEARTIEVKRDLLDPSQKEYTLGEFIEYSEDDVRKQFKELQALYGLKVIKNAVAPEGKSGVIWVDISQEPNIVNTWDGAQWVKASPTKAEEIGAETPEGAQKKADVAETNAKEYTSTEINQIQQDVQNAIDQSNSAVDSANQATSDAQTAIFQSQSAFDNAQSALSTANALQNRMSDAEGNISTLQQTSSSFATRISNTEGNISSLTQTAQGLQTQVNDKVSSSQFTQLSNVVNLKMDSTTADGKYATQSQLTATSNSLTSKITQVQTNLDNLQVGGRNLLVKSETLDGIHTWGNGQTNTFGTKQSDGYYRFPLIIGTSSKISEILRDSPTVSIIEGQTYTESFLFKTDSTTLNFKFTFYTNKHNQVPAIIVDIGNGIKKAYATWKSDFTGGVRAFDINTFTFTDGTYIDICKPKFEVGNVPTDWTPAPEDMATQSQISQLSNDINLRVSKNDVVNQINVDTSGILIDGKKVHITGQTTIDNAVITDAMIQNVSASKMTTGTLDAGKVNVINLNASNISTGTLNGVTLISQDGNGRSVVVANGMIQIEDSGFIMTLYGGELQIANKHTNQQFTILMNDYAATQIVSDYGFDIFGGPVQISEAFTVTGKSKFIVDPFIDVSTFQNGWSNYSGYQQASYHKDPFGFVTLRGVIKGGSIGYVPAFTLPSGYRPTANEFFGTTLAGTANSTRIEVSTAGEVMIVAGDTAYTSLSGIRFYAGN